MKNKKLAMSRSITIKALIVMLLLLFAENNVFSQVSRQKYSYGNLQGVTRYGASISYFKDYSKGGSLNYIKLYRGRNYLKYDIQLRERITETENATAGYFQLSYGNFLRQVGNRTFLRLLVGPEIGYERKVSYLIDEKKDFLFGGAHVGLEFEYFFSRRIILYGSAQQYGHYYLKQIRTDYLFNTGLRFSIL